MHKFVVLLALVAVALSEYTDDLKVKWGIGLTGGTDFAIDVPMFESEAISAGWENFARNSGSHLPTLKLYCQPEDLSFCLLFDQNEFVSGYQINVAVAKMTNTPIDPETLGFTIWTNNEIEYWSNEMFFIDEDISETVSESVLLRRGAVWARGYTSSELIEISTDPDTIVANTLYTKQGCVPTMGSHHYYDMSTETDCNNMFPWFTLYDDDQLIGMGFMLLGTYAEHTGDSVEMFERPDRTAVETIVTSAPECLYDMTEKNGALTMHVYFISNPSSAGLNVDCVLNLG